MNTAQLAAVKAEALSDAPAEPAAPGEPPAGGAQQPPPLTEEQQLEADAREWAEIPATFGAVVTMPGALPELAEVYSDENCMEWGRAMAPIARLYNWKAGRGMLWLRLVGVTFALVKPTVQAVVKRRREAAKEAEGPNAGARPAGKGEEIPVSSVNAGVN